MYSLRALLRGGGGGISGHPHTSHRAPLPQSDFFGGKLCERCRSQHPGDGTGEPPVLGVGMMGTRSPPPQPTLCPPPQAFRNSHIAAGRGFRAVLRGQRGLHDLVEAGVPHADSQLWREGQGETSPGHRGATPPPQNPGRACPGMSHPHRGGMERGIHWIQPAPCHPPSPPEMSLCPSNSLLEQGAGPGGLPASSPLLVITSQSSPCIPGAPC